MLLKLDKVTKEFRQPTGWGRPPNVFTALKDVSLSINAGESFGLVGESGSGKTTLTRCILRLEEITSGSIYFDGADLTKMSAPEVRALRSQIQIVFQDPYASLNPRMTVADILAEPLRFHRLTVSEPETLRRVEELLSLVGLSPASLAKYPHEFSGGQRQRISIARALAVSPEFIVADEPISSLDVNIQAQIINLLIELQQRLGLTYLFIAHDLAVVRHISDRIAVLYLGKVMEIAPAADLFQDPLHPYTRSLISAVPVPDVAVERGRHRLLLAGDPPSALNPPSGCRFRTRCPIARDVCAKEVPPLVEHRPSQWVACHFPGK